MELLHGYPTDMSGRSDREIRFATKDLVEKILPELGIEPAIVRLVGTE